MESIYALFLGILQGLTEFLPVSSSAHLTLAPYLFRFQDPGLSFDVALHMGTLAAILIYFWRDWVELMRQLLGKKKVKDAINWKLLIQGTLPAALAGVFLEKYAEHTFRHPILIALTLSIFGGLLWYWDARGKKNRTLSDTTARDALIIGLAQALALIPGVSRSGVTITAALALGLSRPASMRFSFLLSAPIIAGAGLLKAKYIFQALSAGGAQASAIGLGFFSSLASGFLAIGFLSLLARNRTFRGFAIYRLALSIIIIIVVVSR